MNEFDVSRDPDLGWKVIDALDADIAIINTQGSILAVNRAWHRSAACTNPGPALRPGIGEDYLRVFSGSPDAPHAQEALTGISAILEGARQPFSLEYRCHISPVERWFQLTAAPLAGECESGAAAVISHVNITARKQREDTLIASEARFRSLVLHGMEAISIADDDGIILYEVPAIERLLGFRPEELVGQIMPGIHPDDIGEAGRALTAARRLPGSHFDFTIRIRHKQGHYRHLAMTATNMLEDPAIRGWVYNFRDVTDQLVAEAELQFQAQFLNQAPVAMIAMDIDGVVTHWNRYAQELFEWTESEAIGKSVLDLLIRPDDEAQILEIHAGLLGGKAWQGDLVLHRKNASLIDVHAHSSPLLDIQGNFAGMLVVIVDISERKRLENELRHVATHDPLTDLPNRTLFTDRLGTALARSAKLGTTIAVLFIDLDRFKFVNDSFGHSAGDIVLRGIANRLKQVLPASATLARRGGDEFVAVLEDIGREENARIIAEQLQAAITPPINIGEHEVQIGASIGIALGVAGRADSESLMRQADAALYRVKATGRAGVFVFNPDAVSFTTRDLSLKRDLRRALKRNELKLHYQPIVELETSRIVRVEALLRWTHPQYGPVSPAEFIPIAEEMGLFAPIESWVVREACQQMARWDAARPDAEKVVVAINLSVRTFGSPRLVDDILAALKDAGLGTERLTIEITEDVLIQDIAGTVRTLSRLRDAGFNVAIDDFGAGYSSLGYLRELPLDEVKLDRAFVSGLGTEAGSLVIVEAMIQMSHALDLRVTAEGIEKREQLALLRGMGCDQGQGFFFSPAVHPDEAGAMQQSAFPEIPEIAVTMA